MVKTGWENDFTRGIVFDEEDPFEGETPDQVRVFDVHGNELDPSEIGE